MRQAIYYLYIYMWHYIPIYVGITNDIIRRNQEHKNDKWYSKCDRIYFAKIGNKNDALLYEGYLIAKFKTEYNIKPSNRWETYVGNIEYELKHGYRWFKIDLSEIEDIKTTEDFYAYLISVIKRGSYFYSDELSYMYGVTDLIRL